MKLLLFFYCLICRLCERFTLLKNWEELTDIGIGYKSVKDYDRLSFQYVINEFPYKSGKSVFSGFFPVSCGQYFFKDLLINRNSASWARIWTCYNLDKKNVVEEWAVTTREDGLKRVHFCTVARDFDGWRFFDVNNCGNGVCKNAEEAVKTGVLNEMIYPFGSHIAIKRYKKFIPKLEV